MATIIPFPTKKSFVEQFKGKIPDDIFTHMEDAYDRVVKLKDEYPSAEFQVAPRFEEKGKQLKEDYERYALLLLKRILELEAELCFAKRKL